MAAEALRRYAILERIGVFGIGPGRRGAGRFLQVSERVLADPANMLWITAEGRFTDPRQRPLRLRPGLAHLARRARPAILLPLAMEYGFWNESRPEAMLRFGPAIDAAELAAHGVPAITARLEDELSRCMDVLASESASRDPDLFQALIEGGAGIGGIYDHWRRLRAWSAGSRFDPSHEGQK